MSDVSSFFLVLIFFRVLFLFSFQVADQTVNVDITTTSLDDLLSQSDFITLHIPAQADGKPVIGNDEFAKMKDGVIIANAARGGVIDEDALLLVEF